MYKGCVFITQILVSVYTYKGCVFITQILVAVYTYKGCVFITQILVSVYTYKGCVFITQILVSVYTYKGGCSSHRSISLCICRKGAYQRSFTYQVCRRNVFITDSPACTPLVTSLCICRRVGGVGRGGWLGWGLITQSLISVYMWKGVCLSHRSLSLFIRRKGGVHHTDPCLCVYIERGVFITQILVSVYT